MLVAVLEELWCSVWAPDVPDNRPPQSLIGRDLSEGRVKDAHKRYRRHSMQHATHDSLDLMGSEAVSSDGVRCEKHDQLEHEHTTNSIELGESSSWPPLQSSMWPSI